MSARPRQLRGWHVLAMLLSFFGVIIAINVAFAMAAVDTFPGEDEARSYTQGLHYNETLAVRRAQAATGWQARTVLVESPQGAALQAELRDAAGRPLDGLALEGVLRWPPNVSGDRALAFRSQGGGVYVAPLGPLRSGRWDLRASAHGAGGRALDFEAELAWPSTR